MKTDGLKADGVKADGVVEGAAMSSWASDGAGCDPEVGSDEADGVEIGGDSAVGVAVPSPGGCDVMVW